MTGVLLSDETTSAEKKDILKKEYDIPMTEDVERGIDTMCNLSEGIYQDGIETGRENALNDRNEELFVKMTARGDSIDSIKELLGISDDTADEIIKKYKLAV